jgi:hypothetical protein
MLRQYRERISGPEHTVVACMPLRSRYTHLDELASHIRSLSSVSQMIIEVDSDFGSIFTVKSPRLQWETTPQSISAGFWTMGTVLNAQNGRIRVV